MQYAKVATAGFKLGQRMGRWYYGGPRQSRRGKMGSKRAGFAMLGRGRGGLARRVARLEKRAKAQELKTHDISASTTYSSTGTVSYLSGIAQGDQSINREGLKINAIKLYGRARIIGNTTSSSAQIIRIIIFRDKDCNGALPTITGSDGLLEVASPDSLFSHETRNRFRIMFDRTWTVGSDGSDGLDQKSVRINAALPRKGLTCYYSGTGSAIADADANGLFMLIIVADDGTNHPTVSSNLRLRYYG